MNALQRLREAGQSVWLDYLRRGLVTGGGLDGLVQEDGLGGVTSNPTIFGKAIGGSTDYDEAIRQVVEKGDRSPIEVFYDLALADIQMAADAMRVVYESTAGADGFVSFELEPRLARDTAGSVRAALELFQRIGKPNVMIKVPGTAEGIPAVEELIAQGVNVNITLLFSVEVYERVARAYIAGLERRLAAGEPVDRVASVASFFVSRVDTAVDAALPEGSLLRGTAAVANAKVAYQRFRRIFAGEAWERLATAGARVQRPLWASTGTKNPAYSDVLYIEELVGPDTVNTMPQQTMDAFRDHGRVRPLAITEGIEEAEAGLALLPEHGVDLGRVTARLEEEGIRAFDTDLGKLLQTIEAKMDEIRAGRARRVAVLGRLEPRVTRRLERLTNKKVISRIWRRDHTVWKRDPTEISDRLGWLTVTELMHERVEELEAFARRAVADGFTHAVLLGMGGSSLAPEVLTRTFGVAPGALDLIVLDTTHPWAVSRVAETLDLDRTLFVVASKSGGTVETLSHLAFFYDKVGRGEQFCAITDSGTPLSALARARGFRAVFLNPSDIGGRYSALSLFGLLPGALIGADLHGLLHAADEMAGACHPWVPDDENPGAWLGVVLGEAARAGRDKLTLFAPAEIQSFGVWVEQLIAESTGKEGRGIVPIVDEDLGPPKVYGRDRLFVALGDHQGLEALEEKGHPVVRLLSEGGPSLAAELFRFEFATAVAGHVLGINPFDQPNVAEAKVATKSILDAGLPQAPEPDDVGSLLESLERGDYVAIQAYLDPTPEISSALQRVRLAIRDRYRVATTLGFGPRFLHSTGQLHKGGPDTGVFIQVVDQARGIDVPIPGSSYTFGTLIDAQALGDLRSLRARGRRVARTTLDRLQEATAGLARRRRTAPARKPRAHAEGSE
jgi:transaldolase/glucose-6-phosphate isomerase